MKIEDVIRESVVALFSNSVIADFLVLKGGAALQLSERIDNRLSTDIDFSIQNKIETPEEFFKTVESALTRHFKGYGFEVIDVSSRPRPKSRKAETPKFWGGWDFTFKLSELENSKQAGRTKTRSAMIPKGAASSKIQIDISEVEYCGSTIEIEIDGTKIRAYSSALLVLEKLRAICQQHSLYKYGRTKNRIRDYYDIYQLVRKYRNSKKFFDELKKHIIAVFEAKEVPMILLEKIFDEDFSIVQEANLIELKDTVGERLESFEFYNQQLRWLISRISTNQLLP